MIYYKILNKLDQVIATNILEATRLNNFVSRELVIENGKVVLFSDNIILTKRSKWFRMLGELCAPIIESLYLHFVEMVKGNSHSLKKIQTQLNQKIEGIVPNLMLVESLGYRDQKESIKKKINEDLELTADTLIYLKKRIFELDAHILSFEIIYLGSEIILDVRPHNLRRLLLNIFHAFGDIFQERYIEVGFQFDDKYAEDNQIQLDYKTFNTALYNFFDNTAKYAMPASKMMFYFDTQDKKFQLKVRMISLRIEQEELQDIFRLGKRGKNTDNIEGLGVGMYVIEKIMKLNNFTFRVFPDYSKMNIFEGKQYIENNFIIEGRV